MSFSTGVIFYALTPEECVQECLSTPAMAPVSKFFMDLLFDKNYIETFDEHRIDNLKRLTEVSGVQLSLHCPYTLNLADPVNQLRRETIEYYRAAVQLASSLGSDHIIVHLGYFASFDNPRHDRNKALRLASQSLQEVAELCEKEDINLALENLCKQPIESELQYLGDNIEDFEFLFRVGSEKLRFSLDAGHANINEGPQKYVKHFGDKMVAVVLSDNRGDRDEGLTIGEGSVDWPAFTGELKKIQFEGPYLFEFTSSPDYSCFQDIASSFETNYSKFRQYFD